MQWIMDAMHDGGKLLIRAERIDSDNEFITPHTLGKPTSYALITVQDTGIGIDKDTKDRIFEPFLLPRKQEKEQDLDLLWYTGSLSNMMVILT